MESQTNTPKISVERTPKQKSKSKKKSSIGNKVSKKPSQIPTTPQSKIVEDYEPRVAKENKQKSTSKSKSSKSSKPKEKKPESRQKKKPNSKLDPIAELEGDDDHDDDDDIDEDAYEEVSGESEVEFDDLYVNGTMEVRISRLPTSSARLTSIDIVLQTLMDALTNEEGKHFQTFQKLNKNHLNKLLDLNLTNNYYLYKLRDLKNEKANLRNDLFSKNREINENLMKLETLRNQYNQVREKIRKKREIHEKLESLPKSITSISTNESIVTKINKLNNIVDPNWGILDKLKEINSKFLELDQQN